jgi:hypothetical protein
MCSLFRDKVLRRIAVCPVFSYFSSWMSPPARPGERYAWFAPGCYPACAVRFSMSGTGGPATYVTGVPVFQVAFVATAAANTSAGRGLLMT